MSGVFARTLVRLYPSAWRSRYGVEFLALLESRQITFGVAANIVAFAVVERLYPTQGDTMKQPAVSFPSMMKKPTAFVPVVMSFTGLVLVLAHVALYGAAREANEGATAHMWQLLIAGQLPVVAYFAFQWLRKAPTQAIEVLAVQLGAVLVAAAPVYFWNL